MPEALGTVAQYVTEARHLLQDEVAPFRYPDADLIEALNVGLAEARRLRADLFLPLFAVPYFAVGDTAKPVPFDTMYRSALVYYITGRMQLRDEEQTTDTRAASFLQKFTSQLLTINA